MISSVNYEYSKQIPLHLHCRQRDNINIFMTLSKCVIIVLRGARVFMQMQQNVYS